MSTTRTHSTTTSTAATSSSTTVRSSSQRRSFRAARAALRPAAIVAVAIGTAAALTGAAAAPHTPRPAHVLRYGVQFSAPNVIDVPPLQQQPGDFQPGDYVTFSDDLLDVHGKLVGTEAGSGMITRLDSTSVQVFYSMAIELAGGQIAAQGIASNAPDKHLVITGGTGTYLNVAGDLQLIENGDGTGTLTLTLR